MCKALDNFMSNIKAKFFGKKDTHEKQESTTQEKASAHTEPSPASPASSLSNV